MDHKGRKKKEPWRIVVGIASIICIVIMWVRKDAMDVYAGLPKEQLVPLAATTVLVFLLKVAAIAGVVWLIKWLLGKRNRK